MQTIVNHEQIQKQRKGAGFYREKKGVGRGCSHQSPLKEAGGFSLVRLLQAQIGRTVRVERSFLLPAG